MAAASAEGAAPAGAESCAAAAAAAPVAAEHNEHHHHHHHHARRRRRIAGVIFDMDGTLTVAGAIDFKAMRARTGAPPGTDLIAFCEGHDEPRRSELLAILVEEEEAGLERMRLREGCREMLVGLAAAGVHRALLTRNNEAAMARTVALLGLPDPFSIALSRAFTPVKPHPAAIHHICASWGLTPADVVMCGDSYDDMACGRAAGATTVLIGAPAPPDAAPHADFHITALTQLHAVLQSLDTLPPDGDAGSGVHDGAAAAAAAAAAAGAGDAPPAPAT